MNYMMNMNETVIFCAVVAVVAFGVMSASLASKKGYNLYVYFAVGLLFPIAGVIYAAGLPLTPEEELERAEKKMEMWFKKSEEREKKLEIEKQIEAERKERLLQAEKERKIREEVERKIREQVTN